MAISTVAATREAAEAIERKLGPTRAPIGLVLGSGLGSLADRLENRRAIPYGEIPHFIASTVKGHAGELVAGHFQGHDVLVLSGRVHMYEGHSATRVALPIQVLGALGIDVLIVTNASGGVNPTFDPGDLMAISDHINLLGTSPLSGRNDARLGPRFLDMSVAYDEELRGLAKQAAARMGLTLREGVYAAVPGPSYETPAEIRMLQIIGADAVGMSTVPEVIAARHMGVRVLGLSCVANYAAGLAEGLLNHEEVATVAAAAADNMIDLLGRVVRELPDLAAHERRIWG